jgi:hypothetical protein
MHYKGYDLKPVADRQRGLGIFERGTSRFAWICESWDHPQNGLQVVANHQSYRTIREAKNWINVGLAVSTGRRLVFASSPEEAEAEMRTRLGGSQLPLSVNSE